MVMAPANTGRDNRRRTAVRRTLHTNRGNISAVKPSPRMLIIVVIKLDEPRILLTPAICKEKIARSTEAPGWPITDNGGYTVQPVPAPLSTRPEININRRAGGKSQKLILFNRGNAMSGALIINGTNQFPKPPIIVGITKKKIMMKAWDVTITLYTWSSPSRWPGLPNSKRMRQLNAVPTKADQTPKRKYNVPISLWLVE